MDSSKACDKKFLAIKSMRILEKFKSAPVKTTKQKSWTETLFVPVEQIKVFSTFHTYTYSTLPMHKSIKSYKQRVERTDTGRHCFHRA